MNRLALLDYARLAAALAVMAFHYGFNGILNGKLSSLSLAPAALPLVQYGYLGVPFFFMISGYVIFFSARGRTAAQFAVSRAVRLYPAFWLAVPLTAAAAAFWGGDLMGVTPAQVAVNLTMLAEPLGVPYVDGVYWTLLYELRFYLLVLLALLAGWGRYLSGLLLAWPFAMLLALAAGLSHLPYAGGHYVFFAAGAVLAIGRDRRTPLTLAALAASAWLCVAHGAGQAAVMSAQKGHPYSAAVIALAVLAMFGFFLLLNTERGAAVRLPGAALAGALTYPLYLIHAHLGYMALSRLADDGNRHLLYPATAAAMLLAAYAIHAGWERRHAARWRALFELLLGRPLAWLQARLGPAEPAWRMPLAPVLSLGALLPQAGPRPPAVGDLPQTRGVTSGRSAIALALRAMAVGPGQRVLVPAYHSPAMVPPVLWCGATPVFYRVRADASVDLDDVAARLDGAADGQGPIRVLMVSHYFGFPQPLAALRAFCDARGLRLLEDCAHSWFGSYAGQPLGSYGDYAAASSMKFFPVYDGGCLASARHRLDGVRLAGAGPGFELKSALATLELAFAHGRLDALRGLLALPLLLKRTLWELAKRRRAPSARALAPAASDSDAGFDPWWVDKRGALASRLLLRLLPPTRLVARRRRHYLALLDAVRGLPGCRPLHPALPDSVCPWMFPLQVDDADAVAARLLAAGVPLTRFGLDPWPGMDAGVCAHSARLGREVLALPCHQALREGELAWLAAALRQALAAPVRECA